MNKTKILDVRCFEFANLFIAKLDYSSQLIKTTIIEMQNIEN